MNQSLVKVLKDRLLIEALEKSPRLRNDLDIHVIVQYLVHIESLFAVSLPVLHYLSTECYLITLQDGDVFCYQEDPVDDTSCALIIIKGSLCGYSNKLFQRRTTRSESFTIWNAQQQKQREVVIDFGEIQSTYTSGALCGFEDLLVGISSKKTSEVMWHRRKGIHAQEQTKALAFKKDTLLRAAHLFGLKMDRGHLVTREIPTTELSHLSMFTQLSESKRQALVQNAPHYVLSKGESLYSSSSSSPLHLTIDAVILVLRGRLDVYYTGNVHESTEEEETTDDHEQKIEQDSPIFILRQGQSFGDQTLGLALDQLYASNTDHGNSLPIRIVSSSDTTEVLMITRQLFDTTWEQDHVVQSFTQGISSGSSWVLSHANFIKSPIERDWNDISDCLWRVLCDIVLGKSLYPFPPLVLARMLHSAELIHYKISDKIELDSLYFYLVVQGIMEGTCLYYPGDFMGISHEQTCINAREDCLVLRFPIILYTRWISSVDRETEYQSGTLFYNHTREKRKPWSRHMPSSDSLLEEDWNLSSTMEAFASHLHHLGYFTSIPLFLLCELLGHCQIVSKPAGDLIVQELTPSTTLVLVLHGFVSFYSLDNVIHVMEMFRHHPFCTISNPFLSDLSSINRLSSVMYGRLLHILHPRTAFRIGILQDNSVSPATVVAHTDCQLLMLDQTVYLKVLQKHHRPMIDFTFSIGTEKTALIKYLTSIQVPWLTTSPWKLQLLLPCMKVQTYRSGERIVRYGEVLNQVLILIGVGGLALYIHPQDDIEETITHTWNPSNGQKRNVLKQKVAKMMMLNAATTLSLSAVATAALTKHKNEKPIPPKLSKRSITDSKSIGLFMDSVRAALHTEMSERCLHTKEENHRRTLLSAAAKTRLQHHMEEKRNEEHGKTKSTVFLSLLQRGDVYGQQLVQSPLSIHYALHDVYAVDVTTSTFLRPPTLVPNSTAMIHVLSLDRIMYHTIMAKTEEQAELEVRGRSRAAQKKWHMAERKISILKASFPSSSHTKPEVVRNVVNQRCFLTLQKISELPILRDLSPWIQQEIAKTARFEAIERYGNAYKNETPRRTSVLRNRRSFDTNGDDSIVMEPRYYFVLSGRIGLFPTTTPQLNGIPNMEMCLREIEPGCGYGEFEILVPSGHSHAILAVALESTRLLSITAETFQMYWPQLTQLQTNIEYLQHHVTAFQRLDIERLSYLYYTFSFRTFTRPYKILEQGQTMEKQQFYMIQQGDCTIKTKLCLQSTHGTSTSRLLRVQATIADVSQHHMFWLDQTHVPFTLQASSAQVVIMHIAIDRLRTLLSKSSVQQLEEMSASLSSVYHHQVAQSEAILVRIMNEKRMVERGQSTEPMYVPMLHYKITGSKTREEEQHQTSVVSFSSVLASKPINLMHLNTHEKMEGMETHGNQQDSMDVTYQREHQREHYQLSNLSSCQELLELRGSFTTSPRKETELSTPVMSSPSSLETIQDDIEGMDEDVDAVIDVRWWLMVEMQSAASPMRTIRLEPSTVKAKGMGRFLPISSLPKESPANVTSPRTSRILTSSAHTTHVPEPPCIRSFIKSSTSPRPHTNQGIVRKQGFMHVLMIPNGSVTEALVPNLSRRHRRYFLLVEHELIEYGETIDLNTLVDGTKLGWRTKYNVMDATCDDAPIVNEGESAPILRHSFILTLATTNGKRLLLTTESLMEKKKWMTELRNEYGMIQTLAHTHTSPIRIIASQFANKRDLSKRNMIEQEVLEVEYRIKL